MADREHQAPVQGLNTPFQARKAGEREGCNPAGGGKADCGTGAGESDLAPEIWEKVKNHPCYSEQAHHHYARMHVAVAPACNIQCNYCNRKYDCANKSRPGVVSERLTPEEAAQKVLAVAATLPQMSVVGVAGPGDPLANPAKTFKTFELISQQAPDIKLCLSTNGLALPKQVDAIMEHKVDHVTITINCIDPEIGAKIYPWIFYNHERHTGVEASKILIENQLLGLEMLSQRGVLCKVNSVMIPGVNDTHLVEVNRAVKARGAFLHNIMPVISAPEHGTVFGLAGQRGPTAAELKAVQDACEGGVKMMRHCRQCRADAIGLLGEDRSAEFPTGKVMALKINYNPGSRKAYQVKAEEERKASEAAKAAETASLAAKPSGVKILVAVATKGGGRVNEHFGHAKEFQIYELSNLGVKIVGHRRVDLYCQDGLGDEDRLQTVIRAIQDCAAVLVAKIGTPPKEKLKKAGIEAVDTYAYEFVEPSAIAYYKDYLERRERGEVEHTPAIDAEIRQGAFISG